MQRRSPSLRDGLKAEQVAAIKQTAITTIIETGQRLNIDITGVYTALVFFHKFYEAKSLVRNDPFLMSVACLYLGGKVEDTPKSVRDVLVASIELRYGLEVARRISHEKVPQGKALYESLREKVFIAERALLYALDFDFAVQHAAKPLIQMWQQEPLRSFRRGLRDVQKEQQLVQLAYSLSNDCYKTEACLHFSGVALAAASIWLAMKLLKLDTHVYTGEGQLWWVAAGVTEAELDGVEDYLQELYAPNLYATYSDNDLVLQAAQILTQDQAAAAAAAAAAASTGQHTAAALPADIAAANRESWATVGATLPPPLPVQPAEAAPPPLPDLPPATVVQQEKWQQPETQQGAQQHHQQQSLQAKQQQQPAAMVDDGDEDYDELFGGLG